ncbi:hypothetical protein BDP55DRAFT_311253 [Colletotrichum godetiae]|uniref:Uncharacterized protein n=1 Tax=Colletotrichum godetiae TaxID=1209918 RepID=A0AAJ0AUZ3_9PEZI|nr:uncharacterized protein BDP55DRAFT_311253 [Colletotrichum godetiae]KAK1690861.1 hypothetical protein BDP55DRAFT_311253 [Colletotrichum godetiae]
MAGFPFFSVALTPPRESGALPITQGPALSSFLASLEEHSVFRERDTCSFEATSAYQRGSHQRILSNAKNFLLGWANLSATPIKRFCWQLCSLLKSHQSITTEVKAEFGRRKRCSIHILSFLSPIRSVNQKLVTFLICLSGKRMPKVSYSLCLFLFQPMLQMFPGYGPAMGGSRTPGWRFPIPPRGSRWSPSLRLRCQGGAVQRDHAILHTSITASHSNDSNTVF